MGSFVVIWQGLCSYRLILLSFELHLLLENISKPPLKVRTCSSTMTLHENVFLLTDRGPYRVCSLAGVPVNLSG